MHLLIIVAILTAVSASDVPPSDVSSLAVGSVRVLGLCLLVGGLATACGWSTARAVGRGGADERYWLTAFVWFKRLFGPAWLLSGMVIVHAFHWPAVVRLHAPMLTTVPLLDELLVLLPVFAPLLIAWIAFHKVDLAIDVAAARRSSARLPTSRLGRYLLRQVRHYLLLALAPALVMLAVRDVIRIAAPDWSGETTETMLCLPPLVIMLIWFPLLLRYLGPAHELRRGPLRDALLDWADRVNVRVREILIWRTGTESVNAAVVGLLRSCRYVLLSEGLLQALSPRQVEVVFLHEAGHVRRHHGLQRLAVLLLPPALVACVFVLLPHVPDALSSWIDDHLKLSRPVRVGVLMPAAYVTYAVVVLGWCSRLLEHEADWLACRWLSEGTRSEGSTAANDSPTPSSDAVALYSDTLRHVVAAGGGCPDRGGWLHPSASRRILVLEALRDDPRFVARLRRRLTSLRLATLLLPWASAIVVVAMWLG